MKSLIINHKIYGQFKITEPILIELIKSKSLQRLRGVGQLGAWHLHYSSIGDFTRYQHSIGVFLLLRKFDACPEEQIAGLLHDISHTAFSHVIDHVFNSQVKQDYQDKKLIRAFEIQGVNKILKKYRLNPKKFLNFKKFTLLETKLPDICADRIDYTLQDPVGQRLSKDKSKDFLKNLITYKNKFVFKNKIWAKKFARLYLLINRKLWCNPLQSALYQILGDTLKLALDKKIISKKDLFTTDKLITEKMEKSADKKIQEKISLVKKIKVRAVAKNQADLCIKSKARAVDPYFLKNNKLIKLSKVDANYKKQMDLWLQKAKKGFCVKILN